MKSFISERKGGNLMASVNSLLVDLPSPSNISYFWNFGSLLGMVLIVQILTGLFLAMHYVSSITLAFDSVVHISRDVNSGWFLRFIHMNGASFFFLFIYVHLFRGLYYNSYMKVHKTWLLGVLIMILSMATAFMGYVLPWGQMSFWGATVITNLLSAIPYFGQGLVNWVWGGFSVDEPTLNRFFIFHFVLPFILSLLSFLHLIKLHEKESSNPLGIMSTMDKIPFHPYFVWKDSVTFVLVLMLLSLLSLLQPFWLGDPENFIQANSLVTPVHIQPEWYFLFAYAILRSVPNKLGGVVAFVLSVSIFFFLPFLSKGTVKMQSSQFVKMNKIFLFVFLFNMILLTWIGACPVEDPYIFVGQSLTFTYFLYFVVKPFLGG